MTHARGAAGLAPALLGFWSAYFGVVALSNLADLLRALGALPGRWSWVSGNLAFIATSTGKLGVPAWVNPVLLAGVIAWEALAAALFARAVRPPPSDAALAAPFVVSLGLWGVFVLLDEALLIFETGVEATHLRLMAVELLSLLVIRATRPAGGRPALP